MRDRDGVDPQHGPSDQEQLLAQRAFFAAPFPEFSVRASDSVGDVRTVASVMVEDAQYEQVRLRARIDRATAPTIIGGQILYLLHPDKLHGGAEATDLSILRAGLPVRDALVQSDLTRQRQDIRVDAEYNAWWSCLIPSVVVAAIGYHERQRILSGR